MAKEIKHWIYYFLLLPLITILPARISRFLIVKVIIPFNVKYDRLDKTEIVSQNMRRVFPDDPYLDQKVEQNLAYDILQDAATWKFLISRPATRKRIIKLEGREHLEKALESGKGVILLTGHTGSCVSSTWGLGIHGLKVTLLANDSPADPSLSRANRLFGRLDLYIVKKYCRRPVVTFPLGRDANLTSSAVRKIKSLLKGNKPVISALDVPPNLTSSRENVLLLKTKCKLPSGVIRIAGKTGAQIVPFFTAWDKPFSHDCTIRFQEPFALTSSISKDMQKCAEALDAMIMAYPEQWAHWEVFHHFLDDSPNV